ncbi:urea ABC transporter permease subunit UrtB [Aurantimonas sp. VKM B-3413]|uniref:urea ABC transporter permease subunit UrtB n=1 Tax=Aurantimonas sp. VKM B-3413 TaxID=2779401 RepID=UPI001E3FBD11|nr:urea ABC transporter permease subunit UrtB [Aurantimonas sp. VKM B-3413]MCB8837624.1 urea ABC transporter permease subunit UrtB [Aurantimonas sp. VKM B-3413]
MIRLARRLVCCFLILLVIPLAAAAQDQDPAAIIQKFGGKASFDDVEATVKELAATGDPKVARALNALSDGDLVYAKSNNRVFIGKGRGTIELFDPITGEKVAEGASGNYAKVRVKNSIRRAVTDALGTLTLRSPDPAKRMAAANTMFSNATSEQIEILDQAVADETAPSIKARLEQARAAAVLKSGRPAAEKSEAVKTLSAKADRETLSMVRGLAAATEDPATRQAAQAAVVSIENTIAMWDVFQNVWYGLSLGSVLLLAAIGLAITFGVMGVINMAHGEMVMLGAYTTFFVQETIRNNVPGLFGWSLAIALPLAFLVSALVGLIMERGIIRFLYGRPLETLLATFGVSLILQQAVRTIFGPSNRQVGNPDWMSGAFDIGLMSVTWNRMWIIVFALIVFAALLLVLNKTPLGLQMRAVTQNRKMASAMGIRTPWVDAMTFALGSGIAGIAGVALSQIDNVSPNLGQGYIIDSFMVVVFGGVGNLWGTLVGAMTLGVVNKFLEPYAGAVLGKIVVLVLIILFIQKRPRGLFAQKGRFVDA